MGYTCRSDTFNRVTGEFAGFKNWIDAGVYPGLDNTTVFDEASRILKNNYAFLTSPVSVGSMVKVVNPKDDSHFMNLIELKGKQQQND